MFKKNKEIKLMVLLALLLSVLGIVFALVAMDVALDAKKTESVWAINFTDLKEESTGYASSEGVTINSTSIGGMKVTLKRSNDRVTYRFKIKNEGAVDAKLRVMEDIIPTCIVTSGDTSLDICGEVSYSFSYIDGTKVNLGDVVKAGTSKEVMLTVKYTGSKLTTVEISDLDVLLLFEQA